MDITRPFQAIAADCDVLRNRDEYSIRSVGNEEIAVRHTYHTNLGPRGRTLARSPTSIKIIGKYYESRLSNALPCTPHFAFS